MTMNITGEHTEVNGGMHMLEWPSQGLKSHESKAR